MTSHAPLYKRTRNTAPVAAEHLQLFQFSLSETGHTMSRTTNNPDIGGEVHNE